MTLGLGHTQDSLNLLLSPSHSFKLTALVCALIPLGFYAELYVERWDGEPTILPLFSRLRCFNWACKRNT